MKEERIKEERREQLRRKVAEILPDFQRLAPPWPQRAAPVGMGAAWARGVRDGHPHARTQTPLWPAGYFLDQRNDLGNFHFLLWFLLDC